MVAIVKTGKSIRRTFFYNENKVEEGIARCLSAANYPVDLEDLSASHRLNLLLKIAERRPEIRRNSVHISLNFAPGEILTDDKMRTIADQYMERIGFGNQPYLVYRHEDAGHPHLHVVSTKIRPDGSKIDMQNIGRNQSEKARKELETEHHLIRAEDHKRNLFHLRPVSAERVTYGKYGTKKAIGSTLEYLVSRYRFSSIPELNAVLNLYNIHADTGSPNSRTYKNNGLVFRILGPDGKPVGVPVKASLLHFQPTLKNLKDYFSLGAAARKGHAEKLKSALREALRNPKSHSFKAFQEHLKRKGIDLVPRLTAEGRLFGVTYVDHTTRCVFNGSVLGKEYSAKPLAERFGPVILDRAPTQKPRGTHPEIALNAPTGVDSGQLFGLLAEALLQPEDTYERLPYQLKRSKKRKKRKQSPN